MSEIAKKRYNNFDFLKVFAAMLVLIGHGFAIMGRSQPSFLGKAISEFGVIIFSSISGYLVKGSWIGDQSLSRFFFRRSLRIFPALVALVLLSAFVAGPLLSPPHIFEYFSNVRTYSYLRNIGLYIEYDLPGVFMHTPIPYVINGSLWSLPSEFSMYIVTSFLDISQKIRHVICCSDGALFRHGGISWLFL